MKDLKVIDYDFMLRTKGVFFLFADICGRFYCLPGSVIYSLNDEYRQFTHKSNQAVLQKLYEEHYRDRASVEAFCKRFEAVSAEMFAFKQRLESVEVVTLEDYDRFMDLAREMQESYSAMEPLITDKLFSDGRPDAQELITLVLEKKNAYREDFNKLFFNRDSALMRLLSLASAQTGVSLADLSYLSIDGLREVLAGKPFEDRYKGARDYAFISEGGERTYLYGEEARVFIAQFGYGAETAAKDELKGQSVGKKGIYTGKVKRVMIDYNDLEGSLSGMDTSEVGYVLIADSTVPEMFPLMSKALAIVTNVGGLLSHAAITSRELGIPCVVGTRTATETFADGEMIEVNADTGVVRKI